MSDEKPWDVTNEEYADHLKRADEWWASATPHQRRMMWDKMEEEFSDPILDDMTEMAQMFFFQLVRRHPTLEVETTP